ncbi:PIG-L domain-containing protein [Croceivirga lutea]|uniref:PIG-L family deacetylase n=1 Tax=Croceivirga lutea TaxID=1775167 RepID=UPI00163B54C4|nr:PIG-L family deacetylase [Croceivirga lutea]GGG43472.1 PIG-L domain-containing protein [Croceivirga lutea]
MRKANALFTLFFLVVLGLSAQNTHVKTSAEIHHEIQKLNFLGTALYVAAHPDDENQRMISYLDNNLKARTVYLSITRGDGGQNLIGPELKELLGVLRTQELLQARSIDGGEQRFTRAVDFGYSKHPDETLEIWDKEKVLSDVIRVIREIKPDIIINRFDHRSPGSTHGHHTSSAMLSYEAFDLSNNNNVYPDQLNTLAPWQPKRIFFNTSWWFYGSREKFENADKSNLSAVDIGVFYPELGLSNNEIAAMARSQHKCQGFGQLTSRGSTEEYLEFLKGEPLQNKSNLFEGITTTWSRVKGGEEIGAILNEIEENFNFSNPAIHLKKLTEAYQLLQNIEDEHWKKLKSKHLKDIILWCGGIYLNANPAQAAVIPGDSLQLAIEILNRSNAPVTLNRIALSDGLFSKMYNTDLKENQKINFDIQLKTAKKMAYTSPYWLEEKGDLGVYKVTNENLIGLPETPVAMTATFSLNVDGIKIDFEKPVVRTFSRPDKGELNEPFVMLPEITLSFNEDVFVFSDDSSKKLEVQLKPGRDNVQGYLKPQLPEGWVANPKEIPFSNIKKGDLRSFYFEITPPENESIGTIAVMAEIDGKTFSKSLVEIEYDHIPKQSVLLPAEAKIVRLNIKKEGELIGYIAGAGDKVPESLAQIGYTVETIDVDNLQLSQLSKYDGIVMGIRAYNVVEALKFKQAILLEYVKNGGNLIVQYNTANRWRGQFENIAPYSLTISRDRVTNEFAEVEFIAPTHPLVNYPNKIEVSDFDNWVQERGLYFPNEWGKEFTPIFAMNDKGESPKKGSLLVAPYGKGNYIYTGLSFFRELPAGVPGAYKLFANMLSIGLSSNNTNTNGKGRP